MTASLRLSQASRLHATLSDRDVEILGNLRRFRFLSGKQLQRLHFTDGSTGSNERRARGSLAKLHRLNLVARFNRQVGGVRAGSSGYIYSLNGLGHRVLTLDNPEPYHRRVAEPSSFFQDHTMAIAECYIRLHEAPSLAVEVFETEPAAWRKYPAPVSGTARLKPDAYVEVSHDDYLLTAFLELDRGTESSTVIKRKLAAVVAYWKSGIEQQHNDGIFPKTLWLATTTQRAAQLERYINKLSPSSRRLFAVTTVENIAAQFTAEGDLS